MPAPTRPFDHAQDLPPRDVSSPTQQPADLPPGFEDKVASIDETLEIALVELRELFTMAQAGSLATTVTQRIQAKGRAIGHQRRDIQDLPDFAREEPRV